VVFPLSSNITQKRKATEILFALSKEPRSIRGVRLAVRGSFSTILERIEELTSAGLIEVYPQKSKKMLRLTDRGRLIIQSMTDFRESPDSRRLPKIRYVRKSDGRLEEFNHERIMRSVWRAAKAVGFKDQEIAKKISKDVATELRKRFGNEGIPTVDEIQDITEKVLMEKGYAKIAKDYILYQKQRQDQRELAALLSDADLVDQYLEIEDWRVKNSNVGYSLEGLSNYLSQTVVAKYWISRIYPPNIADAHFSGDMHIHDLGVLGPYCAGWDIRDLLASGFVNLQTGLAFSPAEHFKTALWQVADFFRSVQGETASTHVNFETFDTCLAPFIHHDGLNQKEVKEAIQEFFFSLNGSRMPFSNVGLDLRVPNYIKNEAVIIGGKLMNQTYGEMQPEMDMFNAAFAEIMSQGDSKGRVFTFPIPTYYVTKDFDWDSPIAQKIFEVTAKYGVPYFSNFINTDMRPEDVRSMCCRLRIDNRELRNRGGGLFGANPLTGSIGVVTLNLPRIGYLAKDEDEFFERLETMMGIARDSLEMKRKILETFTENGLYPYSKRYLQEVKKGYGHYWQNHFSTIGIIGMNEAILNLFGTNIVTMDGTEFAIRALKFMRNRLLQFQDETGSMYNLEATPAEVTSYRLARIDKRKYPDIIAANQKYLASGAEPFYTESSQLPADFPGTLFEALEHQDHLQTLYTGGTLFNIYLSKRLSSWKEAAELVKTVALASHLPYFGLSPVFSVCPTHGYICGEQKVCPTCEARCEVYTKLDGYFKTVDRLNDGRKALFEIIKYFDKSAKRLDSMETRSK
jgi:ribonucleoside-triphosphate reductase